MEQLKRGHEADLQQLASRHREELEAVRTALSHGRLLSELSEQVEASARGVGLLQARLEEGHSRAVREGEQGNKTLQEHLKGVCVCVCVCVCLLLYMCSSKHPPLVFLLQYWRSVW